MKYCVDEVIDNIVKLENLDTREISYITKDILDFSIVDGDILVYKDNIYYKDNEEKEKRVETIKEKLERLKNSQFK